MQNSIIPGQKKSALARRRVIPVLMLSLFLASAGGFMLPAQAVSDADKQKQQDQMKGYVDQMYNRLKTFQTQSTPAPENDLKQGCANLNTAVIQYQDDYGESPSPHVKNRLWDLYGDYQRNQSGISNELVKAERNVREIYKVYLALDKRYLTMRWKIVKVMTLKLFVDTMTLPTGPWDLISSITLEALGGLYSPKYYPLDTNADTKLKYNTVRELVIENSKLQKILTRNISDNGSFVITVGEAKKQTTVCVQKAKTIIERLEKEQEQSGQETSRVCVEIRRWAARVDEILAQPVGDQNFEIRPPNVQLNQQRKSCLVEIFRIKGRSSIKVPAKDVLFEETSIPPVVAIGPDGLLTGLQDGTTDLIVTIVGGQWGDHGLVGRVVVEVRMGGTLPAPSAQTLPLTPTPVVAPAPSKPGAKPSIGIVISPDKTPYQVGTMLKFTDDVDNKNPDNTYTYTWYVNTREIAVQTIKGSSDKRSSASWTVDKPGPHSVQLVLKSSNPRENDAIIKKFSVEYPPDMEVKIKFDQEMDVYPVGSMVGFIAEIKNTKDITEYRWYVAGDYIGSGKDNVKHKFTEEGQYEIKLGLRMGSNFDEVKVTRTLTVGEAAIGPLGRERNRFEAQGAPENLEILSSYWKGGTAEWSQPVTFNGSSIGPVDHHILYTGDQMGGWNTGFLVYVPLGMNSLECKVFWFSWADSAGRKPHGTVEYSNKLDLHHKILVPDSVCFTRQSSALCEIEWRTTDGSSCRARISKYKEGSKADNTKTVLYDGVDDLQCQEGVYEPVADADDGQGWKTEHKGPHGSISPKADQWAAGGGFVVMSGSHKFDKRWFRLTGGEKDPFYLNDEDKNSPPRHSYDEVMQEAKIKQGTVKIRGHGAIALYSRRKNWGPDILLEDSATGKRFFAHSCGQQTMYQDMARKWVFKDGKWDGAWSGKWDGNVNDVYKNRPMSNMTPAGKIQTLEVFIYQGCYDNQFVAPGEIEYELWFFPREGGGVKIEK